MDEQEFLAAAAHRDAQAMADTAGGRVISDPQRFLEAFHEAEARQALREADPRSAEQVTNEMGRLYQRFLDAWWYGTYEQTRQAALAFAQAMEHPSAERLYLHAAAVQVGDYVRAVGHGPHGERDAATGVVEEINYTERVFDLYGMGEPDTHYGFMFTLTPVVRADRLTQPVDIWVRESGSPDVLRLPVPVDRGRPAWLTSSVSPATHRAGSPGIHPVALARSFDPDGTSDAPTPDAYRSPVREHPSAQQPGRKPGLRR